MNKHTRLAIRILLLLILWHNAAALCAFGQAAVAGGEDALGRLMRGNVRFISGQLTERDYGIERAELAQGQHPYAIVLACADSRVPPEIIFDESLGRLFVVRIAGDVVDPSVLGSVEYAVEHLHTELLLILGHESCGAVKATLSGGELPPNISALVERIAPAVEKVRALKIEEGRVLDAAIRENVRYQMQMVVYQSEMLSERVRQRKLLIAGGVYNLHTGKVELLVSSVAVERQPAKEAENDAPPVDAGAAPSTISRQNPTAAVANTPRTNGGKDKREAHAADSHTAAPKALAAPPPPRPHNTAPPAVTPHRPENAPAKKATAAHSEAAGERHELSFAAAVRAAYEQKNEVMLKRSALMRDERDRCFSLDCRQIPAGENVKLASPLVLNVGGRPQLKVSFKGKSCYVLARPEDFDF